MLDDFHNVLLKTRPRWWSGSLRKPNAQELFLLLALFLVLFEFLVQKELYQLDKVAARVPGDWWKRPRLSKYRCVTEKCMHQGLERWKHRVVSLNLSAQDKIEDGGSQVRSTIGLGTPHLMGGSTAMNSAQK